ncbi:sigma-70 region 4 domain-containing protein [Streptomyces klenkii]|uniref:RNA polymerase sigma factor n=1 Tax=Streptomyces klenkii TaxID=1420899 RepID=UPI0033C4FB93
MRKPRTPRRTPCTSSCSGGRTAKNPQAGSGKSRGTRTARRPSTTAGVWSWSPGAHTWRARTRLPGPAPNRTSAKGYWRSCAVSPPRQGQVLALHLDGYSAQEMASLLGVKASTVRSNLRHAIATLRSSLENYEK